MLTRVLGRCSHDRSLSRSELSNAFSEESVEPVIYLGIFYPRDDHVDVAGTRCDLRAAAAVLQLLLLLRWTQRTQ